jgi:hypothetical protein
MWVQNQAGGEVSRRIVIESSCEHGKFGKHVIDYDPAGDTWCDRPRDVILSEPSEEMVESGASADYENYTATTAADAGVGMRGMKWEEASEVVKEQWRLGARRVLTAALFSSDVVAGEREESE